MLMDSKYAGKCKTCGKSYKVGETIDWTKENGAHHLECAPQVKGDLLDMASAEALADALGFDDVPGRNKRNFI